MSCNSTNHQMNSIEEYYRRKDDFIRLTSNYRYIFEVTKCCGYGEWVTVAKDESLHELYTNIKQQFCGSDITLYAISETGEKMLIEDTQDISVRKIVVENYNFFKPIYPVPASVIYRIYFDDGLCHSDDHGDTKMTLDELSPSDDEQVSENNLGHSCILHNR